MMVIIIIIIIIIIIMVRGRIAPDRENITNIERGYTLHWIHLRGRFKQTQR